MQDTSEASTPALVRMSAEQLVYAWTDTAFEDDDAMTVVRVGCREPGFLDASADPFDVETTTPVNEPAVHAVRDGDDLALLFHGNNDGVHFARLTDDGDGCFDGEAHTIEDSRPWLSADLATAPDGFVASWWDQNDSTSVFAMLDRDGDVRAQHELADVGGRGWVAHTGSDDDLTRLVWVYEDYNERAALQARRILFDGDSDAFDVSEPEAITESSGHAFDATLLWNEARGELAAAWVDTRDDDCAAVFFGRLDGDGGSLFEVRVSAPGGARSPALTWVPEREEYALVWADAAHLDACPGADDDQVTDIRLARISPEGAVLETIRVSDFEGESRSPQVVWTGSEYALVWFDWRDGFQGIHYTLARCAE